MRPRLFVCLGLALVAVSVSVMVSQRVLAQAGQSSQGQRSQDDQDRQKGHFSEEYDKRSSLTRSAWTGTLSSVARNWTR